MQSIKFRLTVIAAGAVIAASGTRPHALGAQATDLVNEVRKELRSLPGYGVFDLLTFVVNPDGSVALGGYVTNSSLKTDAEKTVSGVKGVTKVDNKIEVAPTSIGDDDIRRSVFRAIYRDPSLARYGTAADEMAATRPRFSPWGNRFRDYVINVR